MSKHKNDFEHEATPVAREFGNDEDKIVYNSTEDISETSSPEWDEDKTEIFIQAENTENNQPSLVAEDGKSYRIDCSPFLIGRDPSCHLKPVGRGISRKHTEIFQQSGRLVIKDLNSSNGTKVNGYIISQVLLENNDIISIGDTNLTYKALNDNVPLADSEQRIEVPSIQTLRDTFPKSSNKLPLKSAGLFVFVIALIFLGVNYYQTNKQSLIVPSSTTSSKNVTSPNKNQQVALDLDQPFPDTPDIIDTPAEVSDNVEEFKKPDIDETQPKVTLADNINSNTSPIDKASLQLDDHNKKKPDSLSAYTHTPSIPTAPIKPAKTENKSRDGISKTKIDKIYSTAKSDYIEGDAIKAINTLKESGSTNNKTDLLYAKFNNMHALYEQGNLAQKKGNKEKAITIWSEYLDEAKTIFQDQSSPYQKEAINFLAKEYETSAKLAEQNNNYPEAYIYWERLFNLTGSDEAKTSIDGLDKLAQDLFRNSLRQEYINIDKAINYWQQVLSIVPPSNDYYEKADEKIKTHSR